jgi:hypothetical protein
MSKTFSYRLLGLGKIHEPLASQLKEEGIVLSGEGIGGSATYMNFRAGKGLQLEAALVFGGADLTRARLWAQMYAQTIIDVPLTHERLGSMQFSLE